MAGNEENEEMAASQNEKEVALDGGLFVVPETNSFGHAFRLINSVSHFLFIILYQ